MSGVGPWGRIHNKNCCCGTCECCHLFDIQDFYTYYLETVDGSLGCPVGNYASTGVNMVNPYGTTDEEIMAFFSNPTPCFMFRTDGSGTISGLIGDFVYEAIVSCETGTPRAIIRYSSSPTTTIPTGVWMETTAGFECPACTAETSGDPASAVLWYEVFVDCSACNNDDYVYGPPDGCSPDTIYSLRIRYQADGNCT